MLQPQSTERVHIVVPFVRGDVTRGFFDTLDAIRRDAFASVVTVSLVCAESAGLETIGLVEKYSASAGLPIIVVAGTLTELLNKGIANRPPRSHVLLLDPRVLLRPETLCSMVSLLQLDYMIGFAAPRSNVATLAQFPCLPFERSSDWSSDEELFGKLAVSLPKFHFVPAPPCDCLLVRAEILDEFGLLDTALPGGGIAELDLVMRANRCGYSAVLANHAYVWRPDAAEAARIWNVSLERAGSSYPELLIHVKVYRESPDYEAERLLAGLAPEEDGRRRLLFDLSSLAEYHNGTFESARRILTSAARLWTHNFRILVLSTSQARRFHKLEEIAGVEFVSLDYDRPSAVAFRFGQPFEVEHVRRMSLAAPVNVWTMLDTIAWDCMYLRRPDLDKIWSGALEYGDIIIYISEAAKHQFHSRFRIRESIKERVVYLSLDVREYQPLDGAESAGSYLLVIGNSFSHKRVAETAKALSLAFPDLKIVCLGGKAPDYRNVRFYESGNLPDSMIDQLTHGASAVIYPSLHEGFGLPILRGLAYGKPVISRSLPATRELETELGHPKNLLLYSSTPDLIDLLRVGIPATGSDSCSNGHGWDAAAAEIFELLLNSLEAVRYEEVVVPRIAYARGGFSNNAMEQRVVDLENSLSWRITGPLRAIADMALNIQKKLPKTSPK